MVYEIVKYGDPVLRTKGKRIGEIDDNVRQLAADMLETMYAAHGLGLAAQQVGLALQITVVDVAPVLADRPSEMFVDGKAQDLKDWMPMVLINPTLQLDADRDIASEGCLSFPEIHGDVVRATAIKVKTQLLDGREIEFQATGMLARAIQHEADHLNGVLYIDRMSSAQKASINGRVKRLQKEGLANPTQGKPRLAKPQPARKPVPVEGETDEM